MTVRIERLGDVQRLRMTSGGGRIVRIDVSAYVVRGVMIDTGFHHARAEVERAVRELGVRGAIVTHAHEDHAGNAARLAELGIPLRMRADTEAILRERPAIRLYRRVVWGHPPPLSVDVRELDVQGFRCIHTPGHAADHQVVLDESTHTLFSGDLWLGVRARAMHESENPHLIVRSLEQIAALEPARMFDAHRGEVREPAKALRARARWLGGAIGEIERLVAAGWSDARIVSRVLGGEELAALVSGGEYARRNLVRAVRRTVLG